MENRHSNKFKTKEDQEWHTRTSYEAVKSVDEARAASIREQYKLDVKILTMHTLRLSDGNKRLDLYESRYFKVDTGERGNYGWLTQDELIKDYFGLA